MKTTCTTMYLYFIIFASRSCFSHTVMKQRFSIIEFRPIFKNDQPCSKVLSTIYRNHQYSFIKCLFQMLQYLTLLKQKFWFDEQNIWSVPKWLSGLPETNICNRHLVDFQSQKFLSDIMTSQKQLIDIIWNPESIDFLFDW